MKPRSLVTAVSIALFACGSVACDKPADDPASQTSKDTDTGVDSKAVVEALAGDKVDDDKRLEAIYEAREAKVAAAIPALRELLGSDNPEIVVASAAALEGLDAPDAGGDIVEAASRLSRSHAFEHLRQILFIIGEAGGPQARIYLETVAEGHQVPGIRQTASQVLEEMKP